MVALVVIKTLNREQQQKPDFTERQKKFRREALDLAKCYHPHIVQVYDTFLEDGLQAIVMEHIYGDNLELYVENYFSQNSFLSESEALQYIDQIGQALECVHERRLLHREIDYKKLYNLLATRKWKEADEETARIMLAITKREKEGYLDTRSINSFPCEDFCTIDNLWTQYSDDLVFPEKH